VSIYAQEKNGGILVKDRSGHTGAIDPDTDASLEKLTQELRALPEFADDFKLEITSGYRSEAHNSRVSFSSKSQHSEGRAIDVSLGELSDTQKRLVVAKAIENGFRGLGHYSNGSLHLDTRLTPGRGPGGLALWWNKNETYTKGHAWFKDGVRAGLAALPGGYTFPSSPVPTQYPHTPGPQMGNPLINMIMGGDGAAEYEADMAMKLGMFMVIFEWIKSFVSNEESPFQALFNGQAVGSSDPPTLVAATQTPNAQPAPA
jgi:hypothetical protein